MNLQTPPLQTPYKIKENFGTSQIHGNHMNLKVCSLIAKKKEDFPLQQSCPRNSQVIPI